MAKTPFHTAYTVCSAMLRETQSMSVALILSSGLVGCALVPQSDLNASRQRNHLLEKESIALQQKIKILEKDVARLQLNALEQGTQIRKLESALTLRQQDLLDARQRLQRLNNRVRSFTGPAQAAAALAEAEAAYHVAVAQGEIEPTLESAREIHGSLRDSTAAYEAGDYIRAADLADLVMRRLARTDAAESNKGRSSAAFPEQALVKTIAFRVRVNSHIRHGPGMSFATRAILPAGTEILGLATRGQWVKIQGPGELQGWIYRKLLAVPE